MANDAITAFVNTFRAYWLAGMRAKRGPSNRKASRRRMNSHNPAVIPRNHGVEEALAAAV